MVEFMLLFRGQNTDVSPKINHDRHDDLGGRNGAVYFFDFAARSKAFVHALQNTNVLLDWDSEEDEYVDEGYVLKCHYKDPNPTFLNDISAIKLDAIADTWASIHTRLPSELYPTLATLFEDLENESVYDGILMLEELSRNGDITYDDYLEFVSELTSSANSSIAKVIYEDGSVSKSEYVVFDMRDVEVDSTHKVERETALQPTGSIDKKTGIDALLQQRGQAFDDLTR